MTKSPSEIEAAFLDPTSGLPLSIVRFLGTMTVALFAIYDTVTGEELEFVGTGTLVTVGKSHCILTAAHVWEKLKRSNRVGITLKEDIDQRATIGTKMLTPFGPPFLPAANGECEWGPDIVLLRIPENHLGGIKAFMSFYSLDRVRPKVTSGGIEARVLMGAPGEFEKRTPKHSELNINGFYVEFGTPPFVRGDYDYVDFRETVNHPGIPKDWGGVSGGGLWLIQMFNPAETDGIEWSHFLEGVAFCQFDRGKPITRIRCHAQQTIRTAMANVPTNLR